MRISKGSVTKIIKECREQIVKYKLLDEDDLESYIDRIVEVPVRKKIEYRRKVITETHEKIIEKMVFVNEKNKKRLGQVGANSRHNLYLYFKDILDKYNRALYTMQYEKNNKTSIDFESEDNYNSEQDFSKQYDIFSGICDEYDLPKDFEEPRDRVIYVISSESFYKLARIAKKKHNLGLVKRKFEEEEVIEEKPKFEEEEVIKEKPKFEEVEVIDEKQIIRSGWDIVDALENIEPVK